MQHAVSVKLFLVRPTAVVAATRANRATHDELPTEPVKVSATDALVPTTTTDKAVDKAVTGGDTMPRPRDDAVDTIEPAEVDNDAGPVPRPSEPIVTFYDSIVEPVSLEPAAGARTTAGDTAVNVTPPVPLGGSSIPTEISLPLQIQVDSRVVTVAGREVRTDSALESVFTPITRIVTGAVEDVVVNDDNGVTCAIQ